MTFFLFILLLSAFTIGYCAVSLLWPDQLTGWDMALLKICTAIGTGFGITSLIYFTSAVLWGTASGNYFILEGTSLVFFISLFIYKFRISDRKECYGFTSKSTESSKTDLLISIVFMALCIIAVLRFILVTLIMPHGEWDAWAIWNMRARFLVRGGAFWKDAFSAVIPHPDYPLLVPLSIARLWRYSTETLIAPALFALFYTVAPVFLLFTSLSVLRSRAQGILASVVLLGIPFYVVHGASQYADTPLAFYFLASIVLLSLHDHKFRQNNALLFLAGMMAGFSAWTKNEGMLFIVAIVAARFFLFLRWKGGKYYVKEIFPFAAGLIPVFVALAYFKSRLAPPNDLINISQSQGALAKLTDYSRYIEAGKACYNILLHNSEWVYAAAFSIGYLLLFGSAIKWTEKRPELFIVITLFIMASGYYLAYVITPHDISSHVATSLNRLLLQLWPIFVFAFFMVVFPPEKVLKC